MGTEAPVGSTESRLVLLSLVADGLQISPVAVYWTHSEVDAVV
jgi:hypothetical protein